MYIERVHIRFSNRTSELNWYMMGLVCIVSCASTSTFHHCTMEIIELCVFFTVVFDWMLVHNRNYIGHLKGSNRCWQGDHRTGKGSQSVPWFPHQSNQQLFCWHFQLRQSTSMLPSHDFRIFAMNNNTIQFECGSNPPLQVDWLDVHLNKCTLGVSTPNRIRCTFNGYWIRFWVLMWTCL